MTVPTRSGRVVTLQTTQPEEAAALAVGFSSYQVGATLTMRGAQTVAGEQEWLAERGKDTDTYGWGIYVAEGKKGKLTLIGNTGISGLDNRRGTSGCCIFRTDLWGQGIIGAVHHARMYYAAHVLGMEAVDSAVLVGNDASARALERVGYTTYGMRFGMAFTQGRVTHGTNLLWVNPRKCHWNSFWGGEPVPADYAEAFEAGRKRARLALKWAEQNVTFL